MILTDALTAYLSRVSMPFLAIAINLFYLAYNSDIIAPASAGVKDSPIYYLQLSSTYELVLYSCYGHHTYILIFVVINANPSLGFSLKYKDSLQCTIDHVIFY